MLSEKHNRDLQKQNEEGDLLRSLKSARNIGKKYMNVKVTRTERKGFLYFDVST